MQNTNKAENFKSNAFGIDDLIGRILSENGTCDEAKIKYEKNRFYRASLQLHDSIVKISPLNYSSYLSRAVAKRNLGDLIGAVVDCKRALRINPGYGSAQSFLKESRAELYRAWGAESRAEPAEKNEKNPACEAEMLNESGNLKLARGNFVGAIVDYKQALKLNPEYEDVKSNLEAAQELLNSKYDSMSDEIDCNQKMAEAASNDSICVIKELIQDRLNDNPELSQPECKSRQASQRVSYL